MPGDVVMGDGLSYYGKNLTDAVGRGDVTEERVRITYTKFCFMYKFTNDYPYNKIVTKYCFLQ